MRIPPPNVLDTSTIGPGGVFHILLSFSDLNDRKFNCMSSQLLLISRFDHVEPLRAGRTRVLHVLSICVVALVNDGG